MADYTELLADLNALTKSLTSEGTSRRGRGKRPKDADGSTTIGKIDDDETGDDPEMADDDLGKSITATLANGEQVSVVDAGPVVKSLQDEQGVVRKSLDGVTTQIGQFGQIVTAATAILKSLRTTVGEQDSLIKAQADLIAAQGDALVTLRADIARLAGSGAGRKTLISVHDRAVGGTTGVVKSISGGDLLNKALAGMRAGKVDPNDVCHLTTYVNNGSPIPDELLARVMA